MKSIRFMLVAVVTIVTSGSAQVMGTPNSSEPAVASVSATATDSSVPPIAPVNPPTTARIIGNIPDGTPPPPSPPKPKFNVSTKNIQRTTIHRQGGRAITIQRISPIALPPPPEPPEPPEPAADFDQAAFEAELAETRANNPEPRVIMLGATVYRSKDAPPRTLVRFWSGANAQTVSFWSSADFALISGVCTYVGTDGRLRSLLVMLGNVDIDLATARLASHGYKYDAPSIPDFPKGPATFTIVGKQPAAEVLIPIQSLHDIYNNEFSRLNTAYEGRERARLQHEADLKANPPKPKNITLNYWRTEGTAPAKGGAR